MCTCSDSFPLYVCCYKTVNIVPCATHTAGHKGLFSSLGQAEPSPTSALCTRCSLCQERPHPHHMLLLQSVTSQLQCPLLERPLDHPFTGGPSPCSRSTSISCLCLLLHLVQPVITACVCSLVCHVSPPLGGSVGDSVLFKLLDSAQCLVHDRCSVKSF